MTLVQSPPIETGAPLGPLGPLAPMSFDTRGGDHGSNPRAENSEQVAGASAESPAEPTAEQLKERRGGWCMKIGAALIVVIVAVVIIVQVTQG